MDRKVTEHHPGSKELLIRRAVRGRVMGPPGCPEVGLDPSEGQSTAQLPDADGDTAMPQTDRGNDVEDPYGIPSFRSVQKGPRARQSMALR